MTEVVIDVRANDNFSGVLGNFGSIITGIESAVRLVGQAFDFAVNTITPFVNSATESQLAIANLEATLQSMGNVTGLSSQQLQDMADGFQQVTRFSDEAIINAEAMLLTFGNIGGETFPRATEAMIDLAAKFGSLDQASVMLGKALNDPIAGVTALRRVGVQLSEEQEQQIEDFMAINDIASAQAIILGEVERQVGGLAEAYGQTFAGQMDIFRNRLDEVRETIGTALLPLLQIMMDQFTEWMPMIERMGNQFAIFLGAFREGLSTGDFGALFAMFEDGSSYMQAFAEGLSAIGSAVLDFAIDVDAVIGGVFESLAEGIHSWIDRGGAEDVSDALLSWIENIGEGTGFQSQALVGAGRIMDAVARAIGEIDWNAVVIAIDEKLGDSIADHDWQATGAGLVTSIRNMFANIGEDLSQEADDDLWERILFPTLYHLENFFQDTETGQAIADAVTGLFQGIVDAVKDLLGIASPSSVFQDIGEAMIEGLIIGWANKYTQFLQIIIANVGAALRVIQPLLDAIGIDLSIGGGQSAGVGGTFPEGFGGTGGSTSTSGGQVINQYFAGATINVGSWDEIAYDCIYPNPFVAATSGQLGTGGGGGFRT